MKIYFKNIIYQPIKKKKFLTSFKRKKLVYKTIGLRDYLLRTDDFKFYKNKKYKEKNYLTLINILFVFKTLFKTYDQLFTFRQKKVEIDGVLNIKASLNNVIFTYSSLLGDTKYSTSCGQNKDGKKGSRSDYFVILETITNFSLFLSKQNIKNIYIKLNGNGLIRKTLLKGLTKSKLNIHKLYNTTPIPHNGCRLKKYRRI